MDEYSLVYLVSFKEGYRGNMFLLKTADARKFCSDDCSAGKGWMFQWTTINHFVHQNDQYDGRLEKFVFIPDKGMQDDDFERLGIVKPTISEMKDVLKNIGYELVYKN